MTTSKLVDSWRWFGEQDPVSLKNIKMTGVKHLVSGLHHIPIGEIWSQEEISKHKQKIENVGLNWSVAESIPVHESIKYGSPERDIYISNYCQSIKNIASEGINILCYNFMPIVDWTRTDLMSPNKDGSFCLSFSIIDFIIFDIFILKRDQSKNNDYSEEQIQLAKDKFAHMTSEQRIELSDTILKGLPGSMVNSSTLESLQRQLNIYSKITKEQLKENLKYFLQSVVPVSEKYGVYLGIHPDDPPINLFNIPRIVSTLEDLEEICDFYPSEHNGLTLCVGSLGSNPKNNINEIVSKMSSKVNFLHLRNVICDQSQINLFSFKESEHLVGDINLFNVIKKINEQNRPIDIYFRPDHGDLIFDERNSIHINPGYSLLGRFRGLSEIRGIIYCLQKMRV